MASKRDLMLLVILVAGGLGVAEYLGFRSHIRSDKRGSPVVTFEPAVLETAERLDREFEQDWNVHSLEAAGQADIFTVARRLSLASLERYRRWRKFAGWRPCRQTWPWPVM